MKPEQLEEVLEAKAFDYLTFWDPNFERYIPEGYTPGQYLDELLITWDPNHWYILDGDFDWVEGWIKSLPKDHYLREDRPDRPDYLSLLFSLGPRLMASFLEHINTREQLTYFLEKAKLTKWQHLLDINLTDRLEAP